MIELLLKLSAALCESDITVAGAAALIGKPLPRAGALSPLHVEPAQADVTRAEIVAEGEADDVEEQAPYTVRLTFAPAAGLTLADLHAAFGRGGSLPRSRPGQGDRFQYHARSAGNAFDCTLIAETTAVDADSVASVTLRRDQRL